MPFQRCDTSPKISSSRSSSGVPLGKTWFIVKNSRRKSKIDKSFTSPFFANFGVSSLIAGVYQVLVVLSTAFCSYIGEGSISVLNYADRFVQFVTGVVGISLGTVFFAKISAETEESKAKSLTVTALLYAYLAAFYFLGLFWLIGELAFRIFFGSQFYQLATKDSLLNCLKILALGLPFYLVNIVLSRKLFSERRHLDNLKISVAQIVSFLLYLSFVYISESKFKVESVAGALTFSNFFTFCIYVLKNREVGFNTHFVGLLSSLLSLLCGAYLGSSVSNSIWGAIYFTIGFGLPSSIIFVFFKKLGKHL